MIVYHWGKSRTGTWRQELKKMIISLMDYLVRSSNFLVQPKPTCLGIVLLLEDWDLLYQLAIKIMPHRYDSRPVWSRQFFSWDSLFLVDSRSVSCWQLKLIMTHGDHREQQGEENTSQCLTCRQRIILNVLWIKQEFEGKLKLFWAERKCKNM